MNASGNDTSKKDDNKKGKKGKRGKKSAQDDSRKFLNSYCNNLTDKAKKGKIDSIIGREQKFPALFRYCAEEQRTILA